MSATCENLTNLRAGSSRTHRHHRLRTSPSSQRRHSIRERGGEPSSRQVDDLLDERLAHVRGASEDVAVNTYCQARRCRIPPKEGTTITPFTSDGRLCVFRQILVNPKVRADRFHRRDHPRPWESRKTNLKPARHRPSNATIGHRSCRHLSNRVPIKPRQLMRSFPALLWRLYRGECRNLVTCGKT
jgi:hypothetical protein